MIVYFSCGQGDAEERAHPSGPVEGGSLVERLRDLAHRALVDERVERDELPGHDEDDHAHREPWLAEPVLRQQVGAEPGSEAEVGVQERLVGDRDRGRAQQQRDEEEHGEDGAVAVLTGHEDAQQEGDRRLHQPGVQHHLEGHPEGVEQGRVSEHRAPVGDAVGVDRPEPVPLGEAQRQDAEQREHREEQEDRQGRHRHPRHGPVLPRPDTARGTRGHRRGSLGGQSGSPRRCGPFDGCPRRSSQQRRGVLMCRSSRSCCRRTAGG